MTGKFTKIAMAAAVAGAIALPAGGAMAATKTQSALLGAVLGGVAGAAVGDGRTEAVAIGAVAGAALGAAVNNDHDRHYRNGYAYRDSYAYRDNRPYGGAYYGRPAYSGPRYQVREAYPSYGRYPAPYGYGGYRR